MCCTVRSLKQLCVGYMEQTFYKSENLCSPESVLYTTEVVSAYKKLKPLLAREIFCKNMAGSDFEKFMWFLNFFGQINSIKYSKVEIACISWRVVYNIKYNFLN